jgi:predicted MFS family arabinose efflux permease
MKVKRRKRKRLSWVPKNSIARFAFFFGSELFSFFFIASNFRALAKGLYFWTAVTDMTLVFQGMIITKLMIDDEKARDWLAISAFTLGGACGSLLSIFVTKHLFGG